MATSNEKFLVQMITEFYNKGAINTPIEKNIMEFLNSNPANWREEFKYFKKFGVMKVIDILHPKFQDPAFKKREKIPAKYWRPLQGAICFRIWERISQIDPSWGHWGWEGDEDPFYVEPEVPTQYSTLEYIQGYKWENKECIRLNRIALQSLEKIGIVTLKDLRNVKDDIHDYPGIGKVLHGYIIDYLERIEDKIPE